MDFINRIIALFMSIISFFTGFFGLEDKLNLPTEFDSSRFELVWSDEFDGRELDETKWRFSSGTPNTTVRRGGYWNNEMLEIKDGNLHIYTKYLENGVKEGDKAGWYSTGITTSELFEQTYGYFEARCIIPKGHGIWSAFWMANKDGNANPYPDGSHGGEVDIFESFYYSTDNPNRVIGAVHWGGYGDAHKSIPVYYNNNVLHNIYDEYNTYGMEWNENEYVFYFNGKKAGSVQKDEAVASRVPLYLILTCEVMGSNGTPKDNAQVKSADNNPKTHVGDFVVDYVRVYQYK